ncbi:MAG: murein biosynthesis integral membrane protein MurJ [Candidatus Promineifilaceae bacterium]|nr:murein biosynthesis integral membrane protein MurJ [Candidatus Promineifilaceae bacterium]
MIEPTDRPEALPSEGGLEPAAPLSENQGVVRAAAVLALGNVASRILGLARETVKANLFGSSPALSAFEIAALVPTTLFDLIIGGMVNSSLVPVFSEYAAPERREQLWRVLSTFLSVVVVLLVLLVAGVELFAPLVARILGAYNLDNPELTTLAISLTRLATPILFFLSISSVLTGALYALKRFTLPAFTAAAFNGAIVVVTLLLAPRLEQPVTALVWGMLLGSLIQVLLQLPALRDARLRWNLNWRHPVIRRILLLYAPIVAGLVVNQAGVAAGYNLVTRTGDASLTYMRYATTLYQFPLGLVVTALSVAILPTLSEQALGRLAAFKQSLAEGIRLVLALILPAAIGLFALSPHIVALLFQHGQFTPTDTRVTALVLRLFLFGLPFAAVDQMLIFASYARQDTLRPALVGVVSIVVYVATAITLPTVARTLSGTGLEPWLARLQAVDAPGLERPIGLYSLMIADDLKHLVHTLLMFWLLRRQIAGLAGHGIARSALKSLLAALATGAAAYLTAAALDPLLAATLPSRLLLVGAAGTAGLAVYAALVHLLDISEARSLHRLIRRRSQ